MGATCNYLVALFYKRPIRQGLFGKPIFHTPLDRQFWWLGLLGMTIGIGLGITALVLSNYGWPLTRLWLWLLLAAMSTLVGLQLLISWFLMRALEELSQREMRVTGDMAGHETTEDAGGATAGGATERAESGMALA